MSGIKKCKYITLKKWINTYKFKNMIIFLQYKKTIVVKSSTISSKIVLMYIWYSNEFTTSNPVIFIQYWKKKRKKKKEERSDEQLRTLSLVQKRKRMHGRKRNRHGCKRAHTSYLYTENSGVLAFGSSVVTAVKQCRDNSGFTRVPSSVLKLTTSRPFLNPSWSHFFLSSFFFFAPLSLSLSLSFITLPHIISKGLSGKGGRSI